MRPILPRARRALAASLLAVGLAAPVAASAPWREAEAPPLPAKLSDTGLYLRGVVGQVRAEHVAFAPQYPLWSDGTTKRRWMSLPKGAAIDASNPDAWEFPVGTRFWKEFRHGARVETRYLERLASGWRFATYVWNAEGTEAFLAHEDGAEVAVPEAPGGRYAVPSRADCVVCHEGAPVPVLGFGALQLSPDRDPFAPHADSREGGTTNLRTLVDRGLLVNLPAKLLERPPRIDAPTPTARAALGYLHGNCGHCHNASALDGLEIRLAQGAEGGAQATLATLLDRPAKYRARGHGPLPRLATGHPESSVLALRMRSLDPLVRMPPLGTQAVDREGLALVERWIADLAQPPKEKTP